MDEAVQLFLTDDNIDVHTCPISTEEIMAEVIQDPITSLTEEMNTFLQTVSHTELELYIGRVYAAIKYIFFKHHVKNVRQKELTAIQTELADIPTSKVYQQMCKDSFGTMSEAKILALSDIWDLIRKKTTKEYKAFYLSDVTTKQTDSSCKLP